MNLLLKFSLNIVLKILKTGEGIRSLLDTLAKALPQVRNAFINVQDNLHCITILQLI